MLLLVFPDVRVLLKVSAPADFFSEPLRARLVAVGVVIEGWLGRPPVIDEPGSVIPSFDSGVAVPVVNVEASEDRLGADGRDVGVVEAASADVFGAAEVGLAAASPPSGEAGLFDFDEINRSLKPDMVSRPNSVSFSLASPSGADSGVGWTEVPPQPIINTVSDATIARASQFPIALSFFGLLIRFCEL